MRKRRTERLCSGEYTASFETTPFCGVRDAGMVSVPARRSTRPSL